MFTELFHYHEKSFDTVVVNNLDSRSIATQSEPSISASLAEDNPTGRSSYSGKYVSQPGPHSYRLTEENLLKLDETPWEASFDCVRAPSHYSLESCSNSSLNVVVWRAPHETHETPAPPLDVQSENSKHSNTSWKHSNSKGNATNVTNVTNATCTHDKEKKSNSDCSDQIDDLMDEQDESMGSSCDTDNLMDPDSSSNQLIVSIPKILAKFDALFPFYRLKDKDCKHLSQLVLQDIDKINKVFCFASKRVVEAKIFYHGEVSFRSVIYLNDTESSSEVAQWHDIVMNESYCMRELVVAAASC